MKKKFLGIYPFKKKEKITYYDLFPPIGLEYIATIAKEFVDEVIIVDMRYEKHPIDRFIRQADIIGVSMNWAAQREIGLEIINRIPPERLVLVGGIDATENVNEYFDNSPRLDIIVRGDGEEITKDILLGKPLEEIAGISYRQNGKIVHNPSREQSKVSDLYPDRSLRRYKYKYKTFLGLEFGLDAVMSSRGCPFKCVFCTHNINPLGMLRNWSGRSAESVIDEIQSIKSEAILFSDDNFIVDIDRVEKICDLIIARGIKKIFVAEMRIEIAKRPDILKKMWAAGFRLLDFGIEAPSDETLNRMMKGITTNQLRKAFKVLKKFNMIYVGNFIVGYIDQEEDEMLSISKFAQELGIDFIALNRLKVLSRYSRLLKILEERPEYKFDKRTRIYSDKYSIKKLDRIRKAIRNDFYSLSQISRIVRKLFKSGLIYRAPSLKLFLAGLTEMLSQRLSIKLGGLT